MGKENIIRLLQHTNLVSFHTAIAIADQLSAPFPFQKLGFEQPNIALLYFPFVWLPCFIVPIALLAHLVTIRRLILVK